MRMDLRRAWPGRALGISRRWERSDRARLRQAAPQARQEALGICRCRMGPGPENRSASLGVRRVRLRSGWPCARSSLRLHSPAAAWMVRVIILSRGRRQSCRALCCCRIEWRLKLCRSGSACHKGTPIWAMPQDFGAHLFGKMKEEAEVMLLEEVKEEGTSGKQRGREKDCPRGRAAASIMNLVKTDTERGMVHIARRVSHLARSRGRMCRFQRPVLIQRMRHPGRSSALSRIDSMHKISTVKTLDQL